MSISWPRWLWGYHISWQLHHNFFRARSYDKQQALQVWEHSYSLLYQQKQSAWLEMPNIDNNKQTVCLVFPMLLRGHITRTKAISCHAASFPGPSRACQWSAGWGLPCPTHTPGSPVASHWSSAINTISSSHYEAKQGQKGQATSQLRMELL